MFRHRRLFHLIFLGVFSLFSGCATTGAPAAREFYTRMYTAPLDEVWVAALKALSDYPLKLSNKDGGKIQSEVVNGPYNDLLLTYPEKIELPERFRYSLRFNFAKLIAEDDRPLTRIRIIKKLEKFQDFYTGWTPYPSDGLEERVLLYRVEHILRMEQMLSAQFQQGQQ